MTQKLLSLVIILHVFLATAAYGQDNFKQGYIIDKDNRLIPGTVDLGEESKNPKKILFKDRISPSMQELTPLDINGFGLGDAVFESAIIQGDDASNRDTTFLIVLVKGDKSLYYREDSGKEQFFIKENSDFILLVNDGYTKDYQGNFFSSESTNYLAQLTAYMNDCYPVQPSIGKTKYKLNSMKALFDDYYYFKGAKYDYRQKEEKPNLKVALKAGLSSTTISFEPNNIDPVTNSTNYDYLFKTNFNPSNDITAGITLEVVLPNSKNRWSVSNDFLFSSFKLKGQYDDIQNENVYKYHYINVNLLNIRMHNMLKYKFPINNACIFINGGIASAYGLKGTNQDKIISKFWGPESEIYQPAIPDYRYFATGYVFGGGIGYKNITLEFKNEGIGGISKVKGLTASSKINFVMIGYTF